MKNNIEIFDYLDDTGLRTFHFEFEQQKISFEFLLWDESEEKEMTLKLSLLGVSKFESETTNIPFQVVGCLQANCVELSDNQYKITFLFDLLEQSAGWKVVLHFEKLEIENDETLTKLMQTTKWENADEGYRQMANDEQREAEANEWI